MYNFIDHIIKIREIYFLYFYLHKLNFSLIITIKIHNLMLYNDVIHVTTRINCITLLL